MSDLVKATEMEGRAGANATASSWLEHFPVAFFAVVMGSAGFAVATHRLEQLVGIGAAAASAAIAVFAGLLFIVLATLYSLKAIRYPAAVAAEWRHPVRLSFFAAISIALLLLAVTALPYARLAAEILWPIGTALQLFIGLAIVSAWIGHRTFEPPHLNPAWFIPAVGNILVPLGGVPLGYVEASWFFFAIGLLFWIVLVTLVFNRLIFHHPLVERLVPTLMILVAPPAVAFLAYVRLTGDATDPFARVLFYSGVGLFLLVASQVRRLVALRFALSWWAYSFPLAALTAATSVYAEATGSPILKAGFYALYALLLAVMAILVVLTVRAVARHEIWEREG